MSIHQCMSIDQRIDIYMYWYMCLRLKVCYKCRNILFRSRKNVEVDYIANINHWRLRLKKLTGIYTYATNKFKTSCCHARWSYFWTITPVRHDPRGEKMKNTGTTHKFSFQCGKRKVHQSGSILLLGINHDNCWGPHAASNVYCPSPPCCI